MYHVIATFKVPSDRHPAFIAAARKDGRDSRADEDGTKRFELIQDQDNADLFVLNEGYADKAAFALHLEGPHFKAFYSVFGEFEVMEAETGIGSPTRGVDRGPRRETDT
jgi:autoinducer 2-degrading protein